MPKIKKKVLIFDSKTFPKSFIKTIKKIISFNIVVIKTNDKKNFSKKFWTQIFLLIALEIFSMKI